MQVKKCYLIIMLIMMLVFNNICLAQENIENDARMEVVARSTYLPFKTVKDRFGKKFAQSYFVVQVDIRNDTLDKQFIVQTVNVTFDRKQCRFAKAFLDENFDQKTCDDTFDKNFFFTNSKLPVTSEDIIATGEADLNRSNRNVGFRILAFTATFGSILTGFSGLIGRDGIKGINVLGTTATAATAGLFPDSSARKLENLRNAVPTEDVIIKSKESRTFNIFVPTERIFFKKSWSEYIKPARDSDDGALKLKLILETIMLSSATGVLIDNDAPTVEVRSDDSLRRQAEKVRESNFTQAEISNIKTYSATMSLLQKNLRNAATEPGATASLKAILAELKTKAVIKDVLATNESLKNVNDKSTGEEIFQAIRILTRELNSKENGTELQQQVRDIVISKGK